MSPITNRKQWKNCFASPSLRLINPIYFCGQSVANLIGNNDIITTSYKNLPLNIMMSSQYNDFTSADNKITFEDKRYDNSYKYELWRSKQDGFFIGVRHLAYISRFT